VQLPGRGSRLREQPFTNIPYLVQTLTPILLSYLDRPFAFFGHSMGALISFEVARMLRRESQPSPLQLFVCSSPAPQVPTRRPLIHTLPEAAFLTELRHRYNAIPEAILQNKEILQLLLPGLRADLTMLETYFYTTEDPLDYAIAAFRGLQDNAVSQEEMTAWSEQTRRFSLQELPGDHFFLHDPMSNFLQVLAQQVAQILEQLTP